MLDVELEVLDVENVVTDVLVELLVDEVLVELVDELVLVVVL